MKFKRNTSFDYLFAEVKDAIWYPYVGQAFGNEDRRIMVYAHNIFIKEEDYDKKMAEWTDTGTWADAMEEYTYRQGWWTEAFRFFIKGSVGLSENFNSESPDAITSRVDAFINEIAYLNFIQDLVKSNSHMANATIEQIRRSKAINKEYLRILRVSHCICWGKPTYEYVKSISGYKVISEQYRGKKGFSSCVVDTGDGYNMQILRVHHPSMPSFDPYSKTTQDIISQFLGTRQ